MIRITMVPLFAVLGLLSWLSGTAAQILADDAPPASKSSKEESVFGISKLHQFHFQISAKDLAAMDPKGGGPPFGPGGPPGGPGRPGPGGPPGQGGPPGAPGFGFEFVTVHAGLQVDDVTFKDVGVRYKGNATYMMSSRAAKRPFKIDFDEFQPGANFHGIRKLNLHCGIFDSTKVKESLAYAVFRAAGVPAPQTALAEVKLTVPGKYDAEYLGLYTVVEQVDKAFLKTHFKSDKGLLLKPEGMRGIHYLGDNPEAYKKAYDGKYEVDNKHWQRLIEFSKLINQADDAQFQKEIGTFLDIEAFLRYLAVNTVLVNYDSFMGMGHNYYLYLVPETNKFAFFPWDLDLSFGSHPMLGPMDQQINMSIDHPQLGENNLIDRLLAMPEVKAAFREEVRRVNDTVFADEALQKQIESIESVTQEPLAREQKAAEARKEGGGFGFGPPGGGGPPGPGGPFGGTPMPLKKFVQQRSAAVIAQLEGKSQGRIPQQPFGMGGPGGPGGPGGGLGGMLARPILNAADTNKDGQLSKSEVENATASLLKKWDKDNNGQLDEKELAAAINGLMPAPPFGPPGGPNRGPAGRPN